MTCIIACVEDGIGYMAGDYLASNSQTKIDRKDDKVFQKDNMLFGFTSSYRMGQIIRYCLDIPANPDKLSNHEYLVKVFVPVLVECYEKNSYLMKHTKGDAIGGTFLIIRNGKIFSIENDFQVAEYNNKFWSCGSGHEVSYGAMKAFDMIDLDVETRLRKTMEITSSLLTSVGKSCKIIKKDFTKG